MRPEFTASLMCMDLLDIKHQIEVLDGELDGYHIDIMDGHYCIEEMLEKIAQAARLREENGWHYKIMIDGSCNQKTFRRLYEAGADVFVMGSSGLFSLDADLKAACDTMKRLFAQETGVKL